MAFVLICIKPVFLIAVRAENLETFLCANKAFLFIIFSMKTPFANQKLKNEPVNNCKAQFCYLYLQYITI